MGSWTCDGRPRNGKYYENSYPHEPYDNSGADCEICGLPEEAMQAAETEIIETNAEKKTPTSSIIAVIIVIFLLISGYFLFFHRSDRCKPGMEQVEGECIDPYLENYNKAIQMGKKAEKLIHIHRTPEELIQAQQYLTVAISRLQVIPEDAPLFPQVLEKINLYENHSREIEGLLNDFQPCAIEPKPDYCRF